MPRYDDTNVQTSAELLPLESQLGEIPEPVNVPHVGAISSIDGQPGPVILIATGAPNKGLSVGKSSGGNIITLSISGVTTAVQVSGPQVLDFGAVADGQLLQRSGTNIIGVAAPSPALAHAIKTTAYVLTDADDVIEGDTTGGSFAITLHSAATAKKKVYRIIKPVAANTLTITPPGAETISGLASLPITAQWTAYSLFPNGTNWRIV